MAYIYDDERYDELADAIREAFTMDDYEEDINEREEEVEIGLYLSWGRGTVFRTMDLVAFEIAYDEEIDLLAEDVRDSMERFGIEEDYCDEDIEDDAEDVGAEAVEA